MAKGNMFQGMARGKVGDVVFSRLNGQQVSRVRNRNPRNPRTNAQLVQRAIMATVMQAYSAGKEIFDHSFQGASVGMSNMRRFMKLNADKLRAAVANDLLNSVDLDEQVGRVVAPGSSTPVAFPFIVSEGDYTQNVFDEHGKWNAPASGVATLGAYASQLGLLAGDYYTIVAFIVDYQGDALFSVEGITSGFGSQFPCKFGFVRLKVKDSIIGSDTAISGTPTLGSLFDIDAASGLDYSLSSVSPTAGITLEDLQADGTTYAGGYAIIRSRKDMDLRSSSEIVIQTDETKAYGIASQYALSAWSQGTQKIGDSELILEGGRGFNTSINATLSFLGTFTIQNQTTENYGKKVVVGTNNGRKIVLAVCRNARDAGGNSLSACKALVINNDNSLGLINIGDAFTPAAYGTEWAPIAVAEVTSDAQPSAENYPSAAIIAIENDVTGDNVWPTAAELYQAAFGEPYAG